MDIWAFDAKEFIRTRVLKLPVVALESANQQDGAVSPAEGQKDGTVPLHDQERERCFHTPLGAGVCVSDSKRVDEALRSICNEYKQKHSVESARAFAPSSVLRKWCKGDLRHSVAAAERTIEEIIPYLKEVHISFAALSTNQMREISVGGYASPARLVSTPKFLESLCPMYSYITAWTALASGALETGSVRVDAFDSKYTLAWSELLEKSTPDYWYHGDDTDALICVADLFAFATDRLLYRNHEKLEPNSIQKIWADKGLQASTWIIGKGNVNKVSWYSDEPIATQSYVHHPVLFLLRDSPKAYEEPPLREKRLSSLIQAGEPFDSAVRLATERGACLKFFNEFDDTSLLKDGDIMVYAGPRSKQIVDLYCDMYELEAHSFRETREITEKEFGSKKEF